MKNRTLILTLFSLLFAVIGCTKFGKNITVEGRVLNPITNEPISDITVRLIKSKNLQYYGGYKTIKETTSDINGNFELSAGRTGGVWIVADFNYQNYYELGWDYSEKHHSQLKVDKGEVMHVDYHLVPYGKYKANVININCQGSTDTAYFKWKYLLNPEAYNYWSPPRLGCYSHNDENSHQLPIGEYVWVTKVIRSGITSYQYDTVFVNESGVSIFNINY